MSLPPPAAARVLEEIVAGGRGGVAVTQQSRGHHDTVRRQTDLSTSTADSAADLTQGWVVGRMPLLQVMYVFTCTPSRETKSLAICHIEVFKLHNDSWIHSLLLLHSYKALQCIYYHFYLFHHHAIITADYCYTVLSYNHFTADSGLDNNSLGLVL